VGFRVRVHRMLIVEVSSSFWTVSVGKESVCHRMHEAGGVTFTRPFCGGFPLLDSAHIALPVTTGGLVTRGA